MERVTLNVSGMSCAGCEERIRAALGRLDGVRHVEADHRTSAVVVDYHAATLDEAAITRRLTDAGYGAAPTAAGR